jgi:hypothetical protein
MDPGNSHLCELKREALCAVQVLGELHEVIVELKHHFTPDQHAIEVTVVSWDHVPGVQPGFHINDHHKVSLTFSG